MKREFEVRVGNINKISSKIEDLLHYVKQATKEESGNRFNRGEDESLEAMRTRELRQIKLDLEKKEIMKDGASHVPRSIREM